MRLLTIVGIALSLITVINIRHGCEVRNQWSFRPAGERTVKLEIRLAFDKAGEGTVEAVIPSTGEKIHLGPRVEFTNPDLEYATAVGRIGQNPGRVQIKLLPDAVDRLTKLAEENKGHRLAILIDGEVGSTHVLLGDGSGAEAGAFEVQSGLTTEDAKSLAQGLVGSR